MANVEELLIKLSVDNAELKAKMAESENKVKGFGDTTKKMGAMAVAGWAMAGASVGMLAKSMIDITAKFQTYNAVLKTTLGSQIQATAAMQMINDFASKTPFSVDELTSSFVKLANQGFVPTRQEMRKLGDLASSTGKSFDQLAEGLLDAGTGEYERLKEFGIKAKDAGDKVQFTFKGITTEVDKNAKAIQNYVVGLGDLEGVMGSMAAISETLGGKISNLGDAYDQWLVALGEKSSGLFVSIFEEFTGMLNNMTMAMNAATFLKSAGVDAGGFFSGNDELQSEARRLVDLQKALIGAGQDEIDKAIRETAGKMGFYTGVVGDQFNKMYAKFISNQQQLIMNPLKTLPITPPKTTPTKKTAEEKALEKDFKGKIIGLPTNIESYAQLTDAKIKEDERFAKENTKYLSELEKEEAERLAASDAAYSASFAKKAEITAAYTAQTAHDMLSFWEELKSEEGINLLTDSVTNLSMAFIDMAAQGELSVKNMVNATLSGIKQIIQALLAKAIAEQIASGSSKGLVGLAIAGVGIGIVQGLFNKYAKFADGGFAGFIPGSSYTGDKVHAAVNSGEAILNTSQQREFMDIANGKYSGNGGGKLQIEVVGQISGDTIRLANKRAVYLNERKGY